MKTIFIKEKSILLGQFLKFSGIIGNGGEAKFFLAENEVFLNGELENRRGKKLFNGDVLVVNGQKYLIRESDSEN